MEAPLLVAVNMETAYIAACPLRAVSVQIENNNKLVPLFRSGNDLRDK